MHLIVLVHTKTWPLYKRNQRTNSSLPSMTVTPSVSSAKGRVLIVGATGFIGQFVTESSLDTGRSTYVLVRPSACGPSKAKIIKAFQDKGAIILHVSSLFLM